MHNSIVNTDILRLIVAKRTVYNAMDSLISHRFPSRDQFIYSLNFKITCQEDFRTINEYTNAAT